MDEQDEDFLKRLSSSVFLVMIPKGELFILGGQPISEIDLAQAKARLSKPEGEVKYFTAGTPEEDMVCRLWERLGEVDLDAAKEE